MCVIIISNTKKIKENYFHQETLVKINTMCYPIKCKRYHQCIDFNRKGRLKNEYKLNNDYIFIKKIYLMEQNFNK